MQCLAAVVISLPTLQVFRVQIWMQSQGRKAKCYVRETDRFDFNLNRFCQFENKKIPPTPTLSHQDVHRNVKMKVMVFIIAYLSILFIKNISPW